MALRKIYGQNKNRPTAKADLENYNKQRAECLQYEQVHPTIEYEP